MGTPQAVGLGNKLIELSDRYIICQSHYVNAPHNDLFSIDFNGNIIQRISALEFNSNNNMQNTFGFAIRSIGQSSDNSKFIICYRIDSPTTLLYIAEVSNDFIITSKKEYDISQLPYTVGIYEGYSDGVIKIIDTDHGYITVGKRMMYFSDNGKIKKYDREVLDIVKTNENIYTYEVRNTDGNYIEMFNTYIVKYDKNLNEQKK